MSNTPSLTYILRRNAYRDNSLLLDGFNETEGRITLVARFSKRQAHRIKGMLEPFRLLDARWSGRGEVFTLNHAEEKRRYALKGAALVQATYLNEVLLRVFQPLQPLPELFSHYRRLLHELQQVGNLPAVMQFELAVLATCGQALNLWQNDKDGAAIQPELNYHFQPERGLWPFYPAADQQSVLPPDPSQVAQRGVLISGELLIALRNPSELSDLQLRALRGVVDRMLSLQLDGKTLYARQLLTMSG